MNFMGKLGWIVSLVLAAALAFMAYTFIVKGQVEPHADGRDAILLSPDERNSILAEMRGLLEGAQGIIAASVAGDLEEVARLATSVGMVAADGESPQMIAKLPLEFLTLGMGTHQAMDDLALTAQGTDDPMVVLEELSNVMLNCIACHSSYRLGIEGADKEE